MTVTYGLGSFVSTNAHITTHSQTPIFCIVSKVDRRYTYNTIHSSPHTL